MMQPLFQYCLLKFPRKYNFKKWYKEIVCKSRINIYFNNYKLMEIAKVKRRKLWKYIEYNISVLYVDHIQIQNKLYEITFLKVKTS